MDHLQSLQPDAGVSRSNSAYSHTESTQHTLGNSLALPTPSTQDLHKSTSFLINPPTHERVPSGVSLSVNYIPSKFPSGIATPTGNSGGARKRKNASLLDVVVPKFGGGIDAFKNEADRIGGQAEDDDGVDVSKKGWKQGRWNKFKWILFFANSLLTAYSLTGLIVCLLTWFNVYSDADIIRVGNRTDLILSTMAASLGIFTSLIGWAGILLNNRTFLASYTLLLWVVLIFLAAPGYLTYKKRNFNLEGKINAQWSRNLGAEGRMRIQNKLECCGYFNPFVEATVTQSCYSRSILPGCKARYMDFERRILATWYTVIFSLVAPQVLVMITALLCSNHITYRFGKGMMPKRYRLSFASMAVIMDNYATQLAE